MPLVLCPRDMGPPVSRRRDDDSLWKRTAATPGSVTSAYGPLLPRRRDPSFGSSAAGDGLHDETGSSVPSAAWRVIGRL